MEDEAEVIQVSFRRLRGKEIMSHELHSTLQLCGYLDSCFSECGLKVLYYEVEFGILLGDGEAVVPACASNVYYETVSQGGGIVVVEKVVG